MLPSGSLAYNLRPDLLARASMSKTITRADPTSLRALTASFSDPSAQNGTLTNPDLKPYPFDPRKARELLREAGFPNGFETELVSYVLPQWTASVQGYLQAVGINARVSQMPAASSRPAVAANNIS